MLISVMINLSEIGLLPKGHNLSWYKNKKFCFYARLGFLFAQFPILKKIRGINDEVRRVS